jgi:hypothetical protein
MYVLLTILGVGAVAGGGYLVYKNASGASASSGGGLSGLLSSLGGELGGSAGGVVGDAASLFGGISSFS